MNIPDIPIPAFEEFIYWAHQTTAKGLLNCSSGNLSYRLDETCMLISGTGTWLENITTEQVAMLNLKDGARLNAVAPSGEWKLHQAVYNKRSNAKVVLHFQSPNATILACQNEIPDYNAIIEIPVYIGKVSHLPYIMPGSELLANEVAKAAGESDIIQLANHGQVAIGGNYKEVVEKAVFFELCCRIIVGAADKYKPIDSGELSQLSQYRKK